MKRTIAGVAVLATGVAGLSLYKFTENQPTTSQTTIQESTSYRFINFFRTMENAQVDGLRHTVKGLNGVDYIAYSTEFGKQVQVSDLNEGKDWIFLVDVVSTSEGIRMNFVEISGVRAQEVIAGHRAVSLADYQPSKNQ